MFCLVWIIIAHTVLQIYKSRHLRHRFGIRHRNELLKKCVQKNNTITENSFSATFTSFPLHSPLNSSGTDSNNCCFWPWSTAPSLFLLDSAEAESCASHVKRMLSTLVQSCVYKLWFNLQLRWNRVAERVGQSCMFVNHFLEKQQMAVNVP